MTLTLRESPTQTEMSIEDTTAVMEFRADYAGVNKGSPEFTLRKKSQDELDSRYGYLRLYPGEFASDDPLDFIDLTKEKALGVRDPYESYYLTLEMEITPTTLGDS